MTTKTKSPVLMKPRRTAKAKPSKSESWKKLLTADTYELSTYVSEIFSFYWNAAGNFIIEAVAGSGKTTTLMRLLRLVPDKVRVIVLAFNKHIADELADRIASQQMTGVKNSSTVHSLGNSAITKSMGYRPVDQYRVSNRFKQELEACEPPAPMYRDRNGVMRKHWVPAEQFKAKRALHKSLSDLVSLCKNTMTDPRNEEKLYELCDHHGLEVADLKPHYNLLIDVYDWCKKDTGTIDYDDMVWLPVVLDLPVDQYDLVLVDEVQDLNPVRQALIAKAIAPGGRIGLVGDTRQAIYGFQGADVNSMSNMKKRFDATELPLSITYRCPKTHVELAKSIVPHIEAAPNAVEGEVFYIDESKIRDHVAPGDLLLCRTNKPLVATAFELINAGVKAVVRGRDIGSNLINFIDRFKAKDIDDLRNKFDSFLLKEGERMLSANKVAQYDLLVDKVQTIEVFCSRFENLEDVKSAISNLFSDQVKGVVLSSVHKAKGLEADRVFILHPELMPFPKATQDWEIEQEMNLKYVALTRAKQSLYFVRDDVTS